ncbi:MAG: ribose-phosphate pyrophosphokinase [FCB group bacterium]|nr:ribose-phosphate pyrophosphokinase [FCB group bacterium]
MNNNTLKIFTGRSNPVLSENIARYLGNPLGEVTIKTFADGELWVKYEENIRGKDVFIVQPTNQPADNIIELILMIDAAKRASAAHVTAVIPYFGYGRQDRKDTPRVPISSRVMVDLITATGADRMISMDLHSTQIQGFASIPFDHLYSRMVLLDELKKMDMDPNEWVVLSPDMGSVRMSQSYAKRLGMHFALIDKRRYAPNQAKVAHIIGRLRNKHVLIIDDMIDTAGTTVNAAEKALSKGALSVTAVATHALLSGNAMDRLRASEIKEFILTDTIAMPEEKILPNMRFVSVANIFGEAIRRIHNGESVSSLFDF